MALTIFSMWTARASEGARSVGSEGGAMAKSASTPGLGGAQAPALWSGRLCATLGWNARQRSSRAPRRSLHHEAREDQEVVTLEAGGAGLTRQDVARPDGRRRGECRRERQPCIGAGGTREEEARSGMAECFASPFEASAI